MVRNMILGHDARVIKNQKKQTTRWNRSIMPLSTTTSGSKTTGTRKSKHKPEQMSFFLLKMFIGFGINIYVAFLVYSILHVNKELKRQDKIDLIGSNIENKKVKNSNINNYDYSDDYDYKLDIDKAERMLKKFGPSFVREVLTAYIEGPLNDTIPGTGSMGDDTNDNDKGYPPQFKIPLPLRTPQTTYASPELLKKYQYPSLQTCHDIPNKIPTNYYNYSSSVPYEYPFSNIGDDPTPNNFPELEAPYCPVEMDPFLPWIHDVFPSIDGKYINFIAHNKRRCKTGKKFKNHIERLLPQVALFQPISVQRISNIEAEQLAPELWKPPSVDDDTSSHKNDVSNFYDSNASDSSNTNLPRYRLAPREESSPDGMFTRFICRFHALNTTVDIDNIDSTSADSLKKRVIIGETLSVYPFNYEFVGYRKKFPSPLLTPKGKDSALLWVSSLMFKCPVPQNVHIQNIIKNDKEGILSDGTPLLYVDLIPIRTSVRYGKQDLYLSTELAGPKKLWVLNKKEKPLWNGSDSFDPKTYTGFDPKKRWGDNNVLPRIEASGRWANFPICSPPKPVGIVTSTEDHNSYPTNEEKQQEQQQQQHAQGDQEDGNIISKKTVNEEVEKATNNSTSKPHLLSACLWASATFKTRGPHAQPTTDSLDRLEEWIIFHLMVGFDHIYVYDNSGAYTNKTNLLPIIQQFSTSKITYIDWPSIVCNNNIPAHGNTGERSSQHAAESSCRTRYAPYTEWIASFDVDEYLVPMGKNTNFKDILYNSEKLGTNILSFFSTRGRIRFDKTLASPESDNQLVKDPNKTFLETYNCDSAGSPKPAWANRAKKQMYRTDYVLNHFVHYSTVTKGLLKTYNDQETDQEKEKFGKGYVESYPSERRTDEIREAVMIHAKTTPPEQTKKFQSICRTDYEKSFPDCMVGFPWPKNSTGVDPEFKYNCYINDYVESFWIPKLENELMEHRQKQNQSKKSPQN